MDEKIIDEKISEKNFENLLNKIHNYLEELKNKQINEGLHIMGVPLKDEKLINMLFMIIRYQINYLEKFVEVLVYD